MFVLDLAFLFALASILVVPCPKSSFVVSSLIHFFSCSLSLYFQSFALSFPHKMQVLVGESLVKQTDPATGIARLFGKDISRRASDASHPLATNA